MKRIDYGPAVTPGRVHYTSPSSIKTAMSCLRKWHWEKVGRKPTGSSKAQDVGKEVHDQIEKFVNGFRTNSGDTRGPIALAGRDLLQVGTWLAYKTEYSIADSLETAVVRAGVIPVVGYVDLLYTDAEGLHVVDHKTTSDFKYNKTQEELKNDVQMLAYAMHTCAKMGSKKLHLAQHYYATKGKPKAVCVSVEISKSEVEENWHFHTDKVARDLVRASFIVDSNNVDANTENCDMYGGCPHRAYCRAYQIKTLSGCFGIERVNEIIGKNEQKEQKEETKMTQNTRAKFLIEQIKKAGRGAPPVSAGLLGDTQGYVGEGEFGEFDEIKLIQELEEIAIALDCDISILPPDAPASNPELASQTEKPKKVKGKKAKKETEEETKEVAKETEETEEETEENASGFELYIDCIPSSGSVTSLSNYIDESVKAVCALAKCDDIRIGNDESLKFGKWKGVLSAFVKLKPPNSGRYFADTRGNELAEVVVSALAGQATVCVKGVR